VSRLSEAGLDGVFQYHLLRHSQIDDIGKGEPKQGGYLASVLTNCTEVTMQQADRALSATTTHTSPGTFREFSTKCPTRRGMLAVMALAPAGAIALPAIAAPSAALRPWDRRLVEYRAATARSEQFNATVYRPAWDRTLSMAGEEPSLSFTHTARSGHAATFRMTSETMDSYAANPAYRPLAAPLRDAWCRWKGKSDEAQRVLGWPSIEARQDALDAEQYRTQALLIAEPAPDHQALAVKLKIALTRVDGELMDVDRDALLADLDRLAA
jgi:hypothetical protein